MNKSEIRKLFFAKRLELSAEEVLQKSKLIAENFIKNLLPKINNFSEKKLAFYIPVNNEVDPKLIINFCENLGNVIALPKIAGNYSSQGLVLDFKEYKVGDELIKNSSYKKLLEPKTENKNITPDIIFTPLVAFDKNCNRIGMGGGFYDATINFFRKNNPKLISIGLGFELQMYQKIPIEKLDSNLDFIVSENIITSQSTGLS